MTFYELAEYFQKLENTASRLEMTEIVSSLFKKASSEESRMIAYLLQGRVAPLYTAIEFGMADRMMIRALARGLGVNENEVFKEFKEQGDLGNTAEYIKNKKFLRNDSGQVNIKNIRNNLQIRDVFLTLEKIALSGGEGSQDDKINLMAKIISDLDSLLVRYVVRIPLDKLRLGFSDMTILDSLSWMETGTKEKRKEIESAYNVRPGLGFISETVKINKIAGLKKVVPIIGVPILMASAERMTNAKDILEKIGKCAIEPKMDGFRIQAHFSRSNIKYEKLKRIENLTLFKDENTDQKVRFYSRNLENVTLMYPDISRGIVSQIKAKEAIFEGEAIAYNPNTKEFLSFQETVQRKRKYSIEEKAKEIPLAFFVFDLLYIDGESMLNKPFLERRKRLEKLFEQGNTVRITEQKILDSERDIDESFEYNVKNGLEGIMAKKLDGLYQAGGRGFNWIKLKKSYSEKLSDTIDAVVMGYDLGQGKRSSFGIGGFLIGIYDSEKEEYKTLAKIGTGLTDEEWKELLLRIKSEKLTIQKRPENYDVDKMMECDVWVSPKIVVEIRADEITRSPVHTAGRKMKASKSGSSEDVDIPGYALRFPRLEKFRKDKSSIQVTTIKEIEDLFKKQGMK